MAAYLVPDQTLPMITVAVLMRIGPDLDPPGKEGLAATTVYLLTRSGTAGMTAEQLEERVAFLGAQLESGMGSGRGMMGMGGVPISGHRVARHAEPALQGHRRGAEAPHRLPQGLRLPGGPAHPAPRPAAPGHQAAKRRELRHRGVRVELPDERRGPLVDPLSDRGLAQGDHPGGNDGVPAALHGTEELRAGRLRRLRQGDDDQEAAAGLRRLAHEGREPGTAGGARRRRPRAAGSSPRRK